MPCSRTQWVCKAPNAFRPERFLSQIFLPSSTAPPLRRNFSRTIRRRQEQAATAPSVGDSVDAPVAIKDAPKIRKKASARQAKLKEEAHVKFHAENIDPSSLANTVRLHQAANAGKRGPIRKIYARGNERAAGFRMPSTAAWAVGRYRTKLAKQEQTAQKQKAEQERARAREEEDSAEPEPEATDILFQGSDGKLDVSWFEHLNIKEKSSAFDAMDKGQKIVIKKAGKGQRFGKQAVLDYDAAYVLPFQKERAPVTDIPWLVKDGSIHGMPRLDAEIMKFFEYCRPTPSEQASRDAVMEQTQSLIQRVAKNCLTEPMGSYRNGTATTTSDLDIRLYRAAAEGTDQKQAPRHKIRGAMLPNLRHVHNVLKSHRDYRLVMLRHSRYPLVSAQHEPSGLDIQIVACNDSSLQREKMKEYMEQEPDLFPLFTVIKAILDVRGLCDVFRGGLGSYSLFMMIAGSLKLHRQAIEEPRKPQSIGEKFLDFLHFYGSLDTYNKAVSVEPTAVYDKIFPGHIFTGKERRAIKKDPTVKARYQIGMIDQLQPFLLCVQDPTDPLNDLAHKAFGIKHIQKTLDSLYRRLQSEVAVRRPEPYILLTPALGNAYSTIKSRRALIEGFVPGQPAIGERASDAVREAFALKETAIPVGETDAGKTAECEA